MTSPIPPTSHPIPSDSHSAHAELAPGSANAIRRDSPIPLYFQFSELLEEQIASGHWAPGYRLPSEPEFRQAFGLSRTTIRQALGRLEQEGLIERRKGQGTFVSESRSRSWLLQSSGGFFQEEAVRGGRTVTSVVLRTEIRASLPPWARVALGVVGEGATLERVRSVDGLVAMYNVNHIVSDVAELALPLDDPNESLYERLKERAGVEAVGGSRTLEAVLAQGELARLLELSDGSPVLFIESVSWDRNLRPFECYQSWLRTDRMKIDVQMASTPLTTAPFEPPGFADLNAGR